MSGFVQRARNLLHLGAERDAAFLDETSPSVVGSADDETAKQLGAVEGYVGISRTTAYQTMEGVGGAITWYGNWLLEHPNSNDILDHIFNDLQPSVLRLRNAYNQGSEFGGPQLQTTAEILEETRVIVAAAQTRLGANMSRILMSSWSPPISLKDSNRLSGRNDGFHDTLKKNENGQFMYAEFAKYWVDSLRSYQARGVNPTWISIQNEPDWNTDGHPVCIFKASEDYDIAGYYRAFDVCYDAIHAAGLEHVPEMIGPEATGFDNYTTSQEESTDVAPHWYSGNPRVAAIANHLYDAGVTFDRDRFFERLQISLDNTRREADMTMTKRLFQTEYGNLRNHQIRDPLLLAETIWHTLTRANAAMYLNWDLCWGRGSQGTLLVMDNPYRSIQGDGYELTASFQWFQHFCRFIRPGMLRMATENRSRALRNVLDLAFVSKEDGSSAIIFINKSNRWTQVKVGYAPELKPGYNRGVYYSTLTEPFTYAGPFNEYPGSTKVLLKPESITTIYCGPFELVQ